MWVVYSKFTGEEMDTFENRDERDEFITRLNSENDYDEYTYRWEGDR